MILVSGRTTRATGRFVGLTAVGLAAMMAVACSIIRPLVFPATYERVVVLMPVEEGEERFHLSEDGTMSYVLEGLRIDVKHMSDPELNALFPEESTQGLHSINPYTFGDYVDPAVGYARNRFTVFEVTVTNLDFASVELQPLACRVTTNRPGELLKAYGVESGSAPSSFESYYRARTGQSGNEDYRFNMRMGLVRTTCFAVGERILKGEQHSGFVVFDPLAAEVQEAKLHIRDFILKFNAFGKPLETVDVTFRFERIVQQMVIQNQGAPNRVLADTDAQLGSTSHVRGNVPGDVTRDASAIDGYVRSQLKALNRCFEGSYVAGTASEGEVTVRLIILPSGLVEELEIVKSTVGSDEVEGCIAGAMGGWRLAASTGISAQGAQILDEGDGDTGERPDVVRASLSGVAGQAPKVTVTVSLKLSAVGEQ